MNQELEARLIEQMVRLEARMKDEKLNNVRATTFAVLGIVNALYPESSEARYRFYQSAEEARRKARQ